jgi:Fic-DOC domain mobile mystery protein B
MPIFLDEPDDAATPLTLDEKRGLIPAYITNRHDLNQAEQKNIMGATTWAFSKKRDVLNDVFLKKLHHKMFQAVWSWAGHYRVTERNIGIEATRIDVEIRHLIDDIKYQIAYVSYPPDEIAIRFHHRLVSIHPFPNGNGRHSRLCADLLAVKMRQEPFSWGGCPLGKSSQIRQDYISALRDADRHSIQPLLTFARAGNKPPPATTGDS